MNFDPARRTGDDLAPILGAPAFNEAHSNRAHACKLVDGLEALIHRLGEQLCEFLIVEYVEGAA